MVARLLGTDQRFLSFRSSSGAVLFRISPRVGAKEFVAKHLLEAAGSGRYESLAQFPSPRPRARPIGPRPRLAPATSMSQM